MTAQELKEQILRAEGYAQGFKDGFVSCAKFIAQNLKLEEPATPVQKQNGDQ